jgi:hypothetical protein
MQWSPWPWVMKMCVRFLCWISESIQSAREVVCWMVIGVSTRTVGVLPRISVQEMGDQATVVPETADFAGTLGGDVYVCL